MGVADGVCREELGFRCEACEDAPNKEGKKATTKEQTFVTVGNEKADELAKEEQM